jgi:hypothetical protein
MSYKLAVSMNVYIALFFFSYGGVWHQRFSVNHQSHRCTLSITKGYICIRKMLSIINEELHKNNTAVKLNLE